MTSPHSNLPSASVDAPALTADDFDFHLPPELIAQHPAARRSASRLLDASEPQVLHDRVFTDLPGLLRAGDLVVFNDTRVIPARLWGYKAANEGSGARGNHASALGGAVEVLVERVLGEHQVWAHVRASKPPKAGQVLWLGASRPDGAGPTAASPPPGADALFAVQTLGRAGPGDSLFLLQFPSEPLALLQRHGAVPLPPYITHAPGSEDAERYQTVYARHPGSVAAPTAGLHFDDDILARIDALGAQRASVTLHVGAGTFQPVRVADLRQHQMHSEWYTVPEATARAIAAVRQQQVQARAEGRLDAAPRVVAVGTTAMRALESAALAAEAAGQPFGSVLPGARDTALFITPGYRFRVVDALLTNFHLPKSTLLMLVSAFAGMETVRATYAHAIAQKYRFFSYGDAMWLARQERADVNLR
ncbi:tRNA preQ1(34) S-adenosylmethionine ribosyltransferase-isomerase QueA [Thiomonas bhubaneswarensis]|uniref:S-adenosylmethionine:tRNA ribosyltransferase-isomerase n=1 Tax=Thiomonas bhubaneswarensis TaxID=339866 RepID=A0A0K6HXI5_9BURK|nr:tRNA preQ1(34) S-adenosylmethionine ribosyltransferase-isomerase QueA [Thiomonas bhubaneswarensis]CUA95609.1 S-adenosylmethionine:tRNA ribosyltransferase-isomerase [Thiomonas bhubaneswarensis]